MPPSLPPPPPRPRLFDIERSSSPPSCEDQTPVPCEGLELTVYGLDRTTPRSAGDHLRRILRDLKQGVGRDPTRDALYDAIVVRAADLKDSFDYAYVSLSQDRVPQPRADLLQDLRQTLLDSNPSLRVQWRTQSGPDRTRRAFFAADSKEHAFNLQKELGKWFGNKGYASYANYVSKPLGPWRVTFDFLDPTHVDALFESPPIIDHREYKPRRPRFITPSYGYQVALLGCRDWYSAKMVLDSWIRQLFPHDGSDPIVYSAMELDGDAYTAVLPSWDHAVKVASSDHDLERHLATKPFTQHIKPPPQPGLLYCLNGIGLSVSRQPTSEGSFSSLLPEFAQFRREFEHTRDQGVEMMSTLFRISTQNTEAIKHLGAQMSICNSNSTALAMSQSLSNQLLDVNMCLAEARRERSQSQLFLLQRDLPSDVSDYHLKCSRERDEEIQEYTAQKKRLQADIDAIRHTVSASLPSPTAVSAQSIPTGTSAATQVALSAHPPVVDNQSQPPTRTSTASVEEAMEEQ